MSFYALVGDIGGTNARFALIEKGSVELKHVKVFSCAEYKNFDHAFYEYFDQIGIKPLEIACISFACPIDDYIKMTNNHWEFNVEQMKQALGLKYFNLLNDFTAMAYGSLFLAEDEKILVQQGSARYDNLPRLVVGPGTGLGVGALVPEPEKSSVKDIIWQAIATEGGHISFAPTNGLQIKVLQELMLAFDRVSVERILSGAGLFQLYSALCVINDEPLLYDSVEKVSSAALNNDKQAKQALEIFCEVLGAVTGDLVLAQGARGGVFLCGGILPRIQNFFLDSQFTQSMVNKGRFKKYLSDVPVWLCNAKYQGLVGSAAALKMIQPN